MGDVPVEPDGTVHAVTRLLRDWNTGNPNAEADLMPLVYDELRRLARSQLRGERSGHTLQPTALVHDAYLRMVDQREQISWQSRAHFYSVAVRVMRRILIDHARERNAAKRGGDAPKVSLDVTEIPQEQTAAELLALDEALQSLARHHPRHCRIVEMKFFAGLEMKEIAELLQLSERTVFREWNAARLWLSRELGAEISP